MALPQGLKVQVATPCRARWDAMEGDERIRFCGDCRKNVYNLSALTRTEAEALVSDVESNPCVTFFQRADGTVLTEDCPVGVAAARRRVARAVAAVGMLVVGLFTVRAAPAAARGLGIPTPRVDLLVKFIDAPGVTLDANGGAGGLLSALWRGECATLDKPPANLSVHKGLNMRGFSKENAYK
jgi:hypothetical protein